MSNASAGYAMRDRMVSFWTPAFPADAVQSVAEAERA